MGTFAKLTIFSFSMVGIFALIFSYVPNAFFLASLDSSIGTEKEIINYFSLANVTAYNQTGSANMTHVYSSYHDSGNAFNYSMPNDEYIEVIWDTNPILTGKAIYIFHIRKVWWGLEQLDAFKFKFLNGSWVVSGPSGVGLLHELIWRKDLVSAYDTSFNGSAFYADCNHVSTSIIFQFNQSKYADIGSAFDGNELGFALTYDVDIEATGLSMWNIIGQLLTFQNPDLGITGPSGSILNYLIAIPLWLGIAIVLLYITLAVIPLISGLND